MGIQINGSNDTISAADGGLSISGQSIDNANLNLSQNLNVTGVATVGTLNATQSNPTNINVSGVSTVTNLRATNINLSGITTGLNVSGVTTIKSPGASTIFLNALNSSNTSIFRITQTSGGSGYLELRDSVDTTFIVADAANGRLGIGTTIPNELLEVRGTENQGIRLTSTATSGEGANLQWYSMQSGDNKITAEIESDGSGAGGNLFFKTRSTGGVLTERMTIANDGDVGIGVEPNTERLRIKGSTNNNTQQAIYIANSSDTMLFYINNDGALFTGAATESPYNSTTATAANAVLSTSGDTGRLQRSTSSRRYKKDIESLEDAYADAVLNVRPVWYRSSCSGDNPDWGHWGFIAEEVSEIDPRLVFWKTHETQVGEDGKPVSVELDQPIADGVQYDRFVPHLLNLIKRQGEAIAELQAEVAALKGA